jgi:hypothetical protein
VQLHLTLVVTSAKGESRSRSAIVAEASVDNAGSQPITIDLVEFGSPSLALEILDGRGEVLAMPPPPTPGRPEPVRLEPGARRSVVFRAFVPEAARAGTYRVRVRYRDARSTWVEFDVR